jgi:hypothetical protein
MRILKNMNCVEFSRLMIILTLNSNSQRSANTSHECQVVVFSKGLVKSTTTTSSSSSASLSHLFWQNYTYHLAALLQPPSYPSYLTTSPASTMSLPPPPLWRTELIRHALYRHLRHQAYQNMILVGTHCIGTFITRHTKT